MKIAGSSKPDRWKDILLNLVMLGAVIALYFKLLNSAHM